MTVGALVAAAGFVAFLLLRPGAAWAAVLPGSVLLGLGLSLAVAPLTVTVLAAAGPGRAGIGSGVNTAVARLAGLLGVAVVPWVAGLSAPGRRLDAEQLTAGFHRAVLVCAGLCLAAGVASALGVPSPRAGAVAPEPGPGTS